MSSDIASDMSLFFFPQSFAAVILDVTIEARDTMDKICFNVRPLDSIRGIWDRSIRVDSQQYNSASLFALLLR